MYKLDKQHMLYEVTNDTPPLRYSFLKQKTHTKHANCNNTISTYTGDLQQTPFKCSSPLFIPYDTFANYLVTTRIEALF